LSCKLAFLFPGQGAQCQGMLDDFMQAETIVSDTFTEASDILGYDMAELIRENPRGRLNRTEYTQPALLAASTALLRLWRQKGGAQAGHVAGHSLGEYSALVAAGSLAFSDAVALVAFRGKVMRDAVAKGAGRMAAVLGLQDARVQSLCAEASTDAEKVWPANYNCPGQVVVAGHAAAVERMMALATAAGARRTLILKVSAPSHTPLMEPAAEAMRERLRDFELEAPRAPVWSNAMAAPMQDVATIRAALVRQLTSPVRWTEIIQNMYQAGVKSAVEMGPGRVLSGIVRRIERDVAVFAADTPAGMAKAMEQIPGGQA